MARVTSSMLKVWLSKPDVYPLIAAVFCGVSFGVYKSAQHLFMNPDVQIDPHKRKGEAWEKYSPEESEAWRQHIAKNYRHKDDARVSIFEVFKPSYWQHRREVQQDPEGATASGRTQLQ